MKAIIQPTDQKSLTLAGGFGVDLGKVVLLFEPDAVGTVTVRTLTGKEDRVLSIQKYMQSHVQVTKVIASSEDAANIDVGYL